MTARMKSKKTQRFKKKVKKTSMKKSNIGQKKVGTKQKRANQNKKQPKGKPNSDDKLFNFIEEKYEKNILDQIDKKNEGKQYKYMLPIKTKEGCLKNQVIEQADDNNIENEAEEEPENKPEDDEAIDSDFEETVNSELLVNQDEPLSMVQLLAAREETLQTQKFHIGFVCSKILENPELNIKKVAQLLDHMNDSNPTMYITVRKLAMASLLEVFKDILPQYRILQNNQQNVKLKATTFKLQTYEATLLKYYKNYLQCLEKTARLLKKSYSRDEMPKKELESKLAVLAISCMCELLVTHPYFNFSTNVANFLIPLLDNKLREVREIVMKHISQVFMDDKQAEISLQIVRGLNKYIKQKKHCVHPEMLQVLLSLRIKDVNLEKEKEDETKKKKLEAHTKRIVNLSKKERKRNKQLQQVKQEMLEVQAEENKQTKHKNLTEITVVLFTIYFRTLKCTPNGKVLSACLEGLAKFTHCINIEYYQDIVNCLSQLLENGSLNLEERLNCESTVFTILSKNALYLNIDPQRFYKSLYKDLFTVSLSSNHNEIHSIVKILVLALISRCKTIEQSRLTGFLKRMSTMSLNLKHNATIGILEIVKQLMQSKSHARLMLDMENVGNGIYLPELDEPEHANAHCTSLWEFAALQRHYHVTVQKMASNIVSEVSTQGICSKITETSKMSPEELCCEYDPSTVSFKPTIPPPKKRKLNN